MDKNKVLLTIRNEKREFPVTIMELEGLQDYAKEWSKRIEGDFTVFVPDVGHIDPSVDFGYTFEEGNFVMHYDFVGIPINRIECRFPYDKIQGLEDYINANPLVNALDHTLDAWKDELLYEMYNYNLNHDFFLTVQKALLANGMFGYGETDLRYPDGERPNLLLLTKDDEIVSADKTNMPSWFFPLDNKTKYEYAIHIIQPKKEPSLTWVHLKRKRNTIASLDGRNSLVPQDKRSKDIESLLQVLNAMDSVDEMMKVVEEYKGDKIM